MNPNYIDPITGEYNQYLHARALIRDDGCCDGINSCKECFIATDRFAGLTFVCDPDLAAKFAKDYVDSVWCNSESDKVVSIW